MRAETKSNLYEFLRYAVVGGISAVADMAVNYVALFYLFGATKDDTGMVILSVALGFVVGLLLNFFLSNVFVFTTEAQQKQGKTMRAFLIFAAVGLIGLLLSELLTLLGVLLIGDEGIFYILLSCFVKGIVLIWNYVGRKIFVYREKTEEKIHEQVEENQISSAEGL